MTRPLDPGDAALERLIAECTTALNFTMDPRLAQAQRFLISLRSDAQVAYLEQQQGLERKRERAMVYGRRQGRSWR